MAFVSCCIASELENGSAEEGVRRHYLEHGEGVGGPDFGGGAAGGPVAEKPVRRQGRGPCDASSHQGHHGLQGDSFLLSVCYLHRSINSDPFFGLSPFSINLEIYGFDLPKMVLPILYDENSCLLLNFLVGYERKFFIRYSCARKVVFCLLFDLLPVCEK